MISNNFPEFFLEKSSFAAMMLTYTRTMWLPCTQPEVVRELDIATLLLLEAANSFTVYNEYILTLSPIVICFIDSKKKMKKSLLRIFADADLEFFLGGGRRITCFFMINVDLDRWYIRIIA